jgi:hypothetical protein
MDDNRHRVGGQRNFRSFVGVRLSPSLRRLPSPFMMTGRCPFDRLDVVADARFCFLLEEDVCVAQYETDDADGSLGRIVSTPLNAEEL